jgi:HK97 family phage major capsid protein
MNPMEKLLEQIAAIQKQLDAGIMSKETYEEKIKSLEAQLAAINAAVKAVEDATRQRNDHFDGAQEEGFSIVKAVRGLFLGKWDKENSKEKSMLEEARTKAQSTSGGSGGYFVPAMYIPGVIERLYARTVLKEAGATILTGLEGSPVYISKQSTSTVAYWIGENAAITESGITDAQLTLTPKECAALVKASNKLLMLAGSNPAVANMIENDMIRQIALAIDLKGITGDGSSNTPTGIINCGSGLNTVALGTDGAFLDFDSMVDMQTEIEEDNAMGSKMAYIMHPRVKNKLKKTRVPQYSGDTAGQYVVQPIMSDSMLADMAGYPILPTTQIPKNLTKGNGTALSYVLFGNFEDLIIAQWGGLELASSNVAGDATGGAFSANQTWFRAIQSVDFGVRHNESFCLISDAKTA